MNDAPVTRVALLARFGKDPILKALGEMPGVEVIDARDAEHLGSLTYWASIVAMNDPSAVDGALVAAALREPESRVRLVQALSAGFDGLLRHDLPPDLIVAAQGGAMAQPVAEHAIGLLLGLSRGLFDIGIRSKAGTWDRVFDPPIAALEGRTAVIVGFGKIGREVAKRLRAFDMTLIAVSRSAPPPGLVDEHVAMDGLHAALARADAVMVTIALGDGTRHLFDDAAFAACKPGAIFVNVARGEVVDQVALKAALEQGVLRGAGLDVTSPEPLPADDPLWRAPRLIVSPHTAGAGSPLATRRVAAAVTENVRRFARGEPPLHRMR